MPQPILIPLRPIVKVEEVLNATGAQRVLSGRLLLYRRLRALDCQALGMGDAG